MTSHDDFEDNLNCWLEADAAPGAPVGLAEAVVEATRGRRQDPRWLAALRGDRRGRGVRGLGVARTGPTALATTVPLSTQRRRLPSIAPLVALLALALVGATIVVGSVSYTHLRAHETRHDLVCRLLLAKQKKQVHLSHINLRLRHKIINVMNDTKTP